MYDNSDDELVESEDLTDDEEAQDALDNQEGHKRGKSNR